MAKRKRIANEKTNQNKIKEGRGQGRLADYKPWINIQDVPSKGISPRIKGWKTGREHHFLSQLELKYFFLLEWSEQIIDIREQFPLYLDETLALAKELGIPHPPKSDPNQPIVITTDFLITVRQSIGTREYARTVKYSKDLNSKRVLEKFEIERQYWERRNINWGIVTELDIDSIFAENIKQLHSLLDLENKYPQISSSIIHKAKTIMTPLLNQDMPVWEIAKVCDEKLSLEKGISLTIAWHLIASRQWKINMTKPIQPETLQSVTQVSKGGAV